MWRKLYNETDMVRDGFYYALAMGVVATLVWLLTQRVPLTALPVLLAVFFLWFFRDPERKVPMGPGEIVSPADGVVTEAEWIETAAGSRLRLSIFLNIFDVHVNRAPVAGTVKAVEYREGSFLNAMKPESVVMNEQTLVVIDAGGYEISYKQIAGLLARRIVCAVKVGDRLERGQRVGMIKFGSRVDVLIPAEAVPKVKTGSGSTVDRRSLRCCPNPLAMRSMPLRQRCPDGVRGVGPRREAEAATSKPRHVHAAVAIYRGQHCGRLLRDYAERARIGGGTRVLRSRGAGDWGCGAAGRRGRLHCAPDPYHQRLWPGAGLARGRDYIWGRAQSACLHLGLSHASAQRPSGYCAIMCCTRGSSSASCF